MNAILLDLDKGTAVAGFSTGVSYSITPYLIAYPKKVNSPKNAKRIVYTESHAGKVKDEREYEDLKEASYDASLPSTAKYLLQGLIGVTL